MVWIPGAVPAGMVASTWKAPEAFVVVVAITTGSDSIVMVTGELGAPCVPVTVNVWSARTADVLTWIPQWLLGG